MMFKLVTLLSLVLQTVNSEHCLKGFPAIIGPQDKDGNTII